MKNVALDFRGGHYYLTVNDFSIKIEKDQIKQLQNIIPPITIKDIESVEINLKSSIEGKKEGYYLFNFSIDHKSYSKLILRQRFFPTGEIYIDLIDGITNKQLLSDQNMNWRSYEDSDLLLELYEQAKEYSKDWNI